MNSQITTSKVFFRLNDGMFMQNLPNITTSKFSDKQNSTLACSFDEGFRFSPKKSLKKFHIPKSIPKKFMKHNNKVEDNLSVHNKTAFDFRPTAVATKTCSTSFYKPQQNRKYLLNKPFLARQSTNPWSKQQSKQPPLEPKTLQGIQRYVQHKFQKNKQNKQNSHVKKNIDKFRAKPRKLSKQISQIFHENKHLYMLSRFTLLELKSYYCAILNFSKGVLKKFRYAFEIMLNLANVTVRENIMNDCIKDLIEDGITFTKFLKAFTNIQEKLRKEAIVDYFEILLEDVKKANITYEELKKTFEGRMTKSTASDLCILLYEQLGKEFTQTISKKEIQTLCYENEQFCALFYAMNSQDDLRSELKADSKPTKAASSKSFATQSDQPTSKLLKSVQVTTL